MPQLHFLRQQYKDPTNKSDGAWRFIYVNGAGSIIGSTKYATLQQMQLLDMNGGVMPKIPGQPGVSASSLATGPQAGDINSGSETGSSFSSFSSGGTNTNSGNANGNGGNGGNGTSQDGSANNGGQNGGQNGGSNITTDQSNGQNPAGAPSSNGGGDNSQNGGQGGSQNGTQSGAQNPQSPTGSSMFGPALGGQSAGGLGGASGLAGASGLSGAGIPGGAQMNLAALAQLKPTGPVDGPVLGGFLTGVAGKTDAVSIKRYHGAKKLNQFEFIWNPLEDAAAALQNQMSNMGGQQLGTGMAGTNPSSSNPNGSSGSSFGGSSSSPFGNNPTQTPTQNPTQMPSQPPQ
jgi:hypothetical protein